MLRYSLLIISLIATLICSAKERPEWVDGQFVDLRNSYLKVTSGTAFSEDEARTAAINEVLGQRAHEAGQRYNITIEPNGNIVTSGGGSLTIKARVIDEYAEYMPNGSWRVYVLAQVAKNPTYDFEKVEYTNSYKFTGDAFIPGMAQIRKGSTAKGITFIAAEAVAVGTAIFAECMRTSYVNKFANTTNASILQSYTDKANTYQNVRDVAIAGAAIVYVWNVIDGIVAKGKSHIAISRNTTFSYTPFVVPDAAGISLSLNF